MQTFLVIIFSVLGTLLVEIILLSMWNDEEKQKEEKKHEIRYVKIVRDDQ
jgi:hypothetical protein